MTYSDTTNKNGIVQTVEFYTNKGDAGISGDATLLKVITSRVNDAFDRIMPLLLSYSDKIRWDDTNHSDFPIGKFNIVSGQNNYTLGEDGNSLDILNVTDVRILDGASVTQYKTLERLTLDDSRALEAMSPNSNTTGIPSHFLENNNTVFLYPNPNYSANAGMKVFFEREQSYFASTDTTKEPGIPKPFHRLLPMYAALDWLLVNKPDNNSVIIRIEADIAKTEKNLFDLISAKNPTVSRIKPVVQNNR